MELLDGRVCYASEAGTTASFIVEEDHGERPARGHPAHEPRDSAVLVIPSYRAHGLVGDMEKHPHAQHGGLLHRAQGPQGRAAMNGRLQVSLLLLLMASVKGRIRGTPNCARRCGSG